MRMTKHLVRVWKTKLTLRSVEAISCVIAPQANFCNFVEQTKTYLHSVINKYRPLRFNLELDMPINLLDNIVFQKATIDKINQDGFDINLIKSLKALEHVTECVYDVLEEFGVEMSEYKFFNGKR